MRVTIPEAAQTTSSRPGAWTSRSISAETMKIPEPIMDPTTRAVASSRESALTNSACGCWVVVIWRGNLVASLWGRYVLGPCTLSREDGRARSEEHTSELQSRLHLVCRLLLEKKKKE